MSINSQKGAAPILLLLAAVGLLIFLFISNTFDFKDKLFNKLFPKPPSHAQEVSPSVADEILLKFKPGVGEEAKDNIRKHFGIKKQDEITQIGVEKVKVPEKAKDKIIEALSKNPRVEYAQPNYIVSAQLIPNDTYFPHQWGLAKIAAPQGWDISTGSPSTVIAIVDSGVNINHEDLTGKASGTADDYGHGTLVAGVAAASSNNSIGVAGVCWGCPILSIKVLNSTGSGSNSGVTRGILYAADNGAKVINMSLGAYSNMQDVQDAVNYAWNKGVVSVAAAGNDNTSTPFYPAASNNVVAVGGIEASDTKANISNYGSWLDVMAPVTASTTTMGGSYDFAGGTSIASPHVAGLAGLIFSANPGLNNQQVVDIITSSADDLGDPGFDQYYGWGRINVTKALNKAVGTTPPPPDTTPPTVSITSPSSGATVSGLVDIKADASDNVGVAQVQFFVISFSATDVTSPYLASWDTTKVSNNTYSIYATATDAAGNSSRASTYVTVNNPTSPDTVPPTVSVTSPASGSTLSGIVSVSANASDNVSVSSVNIFVDNSLVTSCNTGSCSYSWDTTKETNGSHSIYASALDSSGLQTQSDTVTVNVSNTVTSTPTPTPTLTPTPTSSPTPAPSDTTPPTVSITNPTGTTVKAASKVNIQATASDNIGISKVEFYVNGSNKCTISLNQANYSCPWSVPGKKGSSYTISVKDYDSSGNTNAASVTVKSQ